jgi:hypothetical protein
MFLHSGPRSLLDVPFVSTSYLLCHQSGGAWIWFFWFRRACYHYSFMKWGDVIAQEYYVPKAHLRSVPDYSFVIVFRFSGMFARRRFRVAMVILGCMT